MKLYDVWKSGSKYRLIAEYNDGEAERLVKELIKELEEEGMRGEVEKREGGIVVKYLGVERFFVESLGVLEKMEGVKVKRFIEVWGRGKS